MGLPEFYGVSLPACHGLMTPADLHILAKTDASVLSSVNAKTLDVRNCYFEAVPALQGAHSPLRPTESLPTLNPSCSLLPPLGGVSPSAYLLIPERGSFPTSMTMPMSYT